MCSYTFLVTFVQISLVLNVHSSNLSSLWVGFHTTIRLRKDLLKGVVNSFGIYFVTLKHGKPDCNYRSTPFRQGRLCTER